MKICNECEKKFGFLEKIFYTESGDMYCASCVSRLRKDREKGDGKFVELKETQNQTPPEQEKSDYYVKIPSENQHSNVTTTSGKWEFRVIKLSSDSMQKTMVTIEKFEDVINKMGEDGWELVSVIPLNILLMKSSAREEPAMVFKRRK